MGYIPDIHVLPHGWFLLKLKKEEDGHKLLDRKWEWGVSKLILQKWWIDFDAMKEPHNKQQIWVILPGLPMVFWEEEYLEAIGNKLGKFVALEDG